MIQQHPFIRITIAYAIGLLIGYCYPSIWAAIFCAGIALTIYIISRLPRYQYHYALSGISLYIALVALGIFAWTTHPNPYSKELPHAGMYHATLLQDPVEKPKTYQCISHVTDTAGVCYKMLLYIQKDSLSGTLSETSQLYIHLTKVQPQTFSYYNKKNIYYSAYLHNRQWKPCKSPHQNTLKARAIQTKQYLLNTLQQHTDSTGYALTSAITLGQKAGLKGATKQYFSASGASHLLAVSGLHVGIIYMAISLLLRPLTSAKWTLKIQQVVLIALLWGYAFLCGLPPSIVRAVIMFSVGAVGVIFHQSSQSLNNVCFAAFAMLVYNPNYLLDMGFQLSFSAVIGIILYMEHQRTTSKDTMSDAHNVSGSQLHGLITWIKNMCTISIVAQLSTLPLILYYFGSFPTYFLLTNLLIIPLGTLLVYACLLLFITSACSVSALLDGPIYVLSHLMHQFAQSISALPGAQITNLHVGTVQAVGIYALLLLLLPFKARPNAKTLQPILIVAALVLIIDIGDAVI